MCVNTLLNIEISKMNLRICSLMNQSLQFCSPDSMTSYTDILYSNITFNSLFMSVYVCDDRNDCVNDNSPKHHWYCFNALQITSNKKDLPSKFVL